MGLHDACMIMLVPLICLFYDSISVLYSYFHEHASNQIKCIVVVVSFLYGYFACSWQLIALAQVLCMIFLGTGQEEYTSSTIWENWEDETASDKVGYISVPDYMIIYKHVQGIQPLAQYRPMKCEQFYFTALFHTRQVVTTWSQGCDKQAIQPCQPCMHRRLLKQLSNVTCIFSLMWQGCI